MKSINPCRICLCIMLTLFISCTEEKNEFEGITAPLQEGEQALSFLDLPKEQVLEANALAQQQMQGQESAAEQKSTPQENQTSADLVGPSPQRNSDANSNVSNNAYIARNTKGFSAEYSVIKEWGELQFSQKEFDPRKRETDEFTLMSIRTQKAEHAPQFLPLDTRIGALQDSNNSSAVENRIYFLIQDFFKALKSGAIDEKLNFYILKSEIPVISRQISRSVQYAKEISEVRVGVITVVNAESRSCAVRILRKTASMDARAELLFYFINIDNQWLINAVEGDFNTLLQPYTNPGQFTPLGTTGVTQGF